MQCAYMLHKYVILFNVGRDLPIKVSTYILFRVQKLQTSYLESQCILSDNKQVESQVEVSRTFS